MDMQFVQGIEKKREGPGHLKGHHKFSQKPANQGDCGRR
jgi:hypothetical protein